MFFLLGRLQHEDWSIQVGFKVLVIKVDAQINWIKNLSFWLHLCYFFFYFYQYLDFSGFQTLLAFSVCGSFYFCFLKCPFSAWKNSPCLRSSLNPTILWQIYWNKIRITSLGLAKRKFPFLDGAFLTVHVSHTFSQVSMHCHPCLTGVAPINVIYPILSGMSR